MKPFRPVLWCLGIALFVGSICWTYDWSLNGPVALIVWSAILFIRTIVWELERKQSYKSIATAYSRITFYRKRSDTRNQGIALQDFCHRVGQHLSKWPEDAYGPLRSYIKLFCEVRNECGYVYDRDLV